MKYLNLLEYIRKSKKVFVLCPGYVVYYHEDQIIQCYMVKEVRTGVVQYAFFPRSGYMHVVWQFNLPIKSSTSTAYLRKKASVLNAFQKVIETDGYRVRSYIQIKAGL